VRLIPSRRQSTTTIIMKYYDEIVALLESGEYVLETFNDCFGGESFLHLKDDIAEEFECDGTNPQKDGKKLLDAVIKYGPCGACYGPYKFGFVLVHKAVSNYYYTTEYDGLERPRVNTNQYLLDTIRNALDEYGSVTKKQFDDMQPPLVEMIRVSLRKLGCCENRV